MKLREVMTNPVIRIHPEETVAVAARALTRYNIGALPVCGTDGRVCGVLTDRDIVTRCLAAGKAPGATSVREIMTRHVLSLRADMDTRDAAKLMGREQIRRVPVIENGKLCGMVSLGDLATERESIGQAAGALRMISSHLSSRE